MKADKAVQQSYRLHWCCHKAFSLTLNRPFHFFPRPDYSSNMTINLALCSVLHLKQKDFTALRNHPSFEITPQQCCSCLENGLQDPYSFLNANSLNDVVFSPILARIVVWVFNILKLKLCLWEIYFFNRHISI